MDKNEIIWPNIENQNWNWNTVYIRMSLEWKKNWISQLYKKAASVECWSIPSISTLFTLDQHLHGHLIDILVKSQLIWLIHIQVGRELADYHRVSANSIDAYISWSTIGWLSTDCQSSANWDVDWMSICWLSVSWVSIHVIMTSIKYWSRSTGINWHLTADVLHVVYMIRNMLINTSHTVRNLTHSSLFLIYWFIVAHSESSLPVWNCHLIRSFVTVMRST